MTIPSYGPQQTRSCVCVVSEADSARVRRLIVREGGIKAARLLLGVGRDTMDSARDQGRMLESTRARMLATLTEVGE